MNISRPGVQNDTLARSRRILGEDHIVTFPSAGLLGLVLWSLGEHQQARQLQTDGLTRSRRILGEDHPETLRAASVLGSPWIAWANTNRPADSRTTPSPVAAGCWARTTPYNCYSQSPRPHPGSLGEHRQARQLQNDTLTRLRQVLGEDHPDTLTSASRLAADLRELGEYQQARGLDEDTLARRRRVLGDDHPDTLTSANNLAADLRPLGERE